MRTMKFRCEIHGEYEIDLEYGEEPPEGCIMNINGTDKPCGTRLTRIYYVPNIRFVGSGFYVNDNKEK